MFPSYDKNTAIAIKKLLLPLHFFRFSIVLKISTYFYSVLLASITPSKLK